MYRIVTLAGLLLILNPLVFAASVEGGPDLKLVPEDNSFSPGETGKFTFSVINNGEIDSAGAERLEQQVLTAEGLTYSVGGEGNASAYIRDDTFAVGTVPDGLFPEKLGFQVSVWDNASSGTYTVPVEISYDYRDSIQYNASNGMVLDYNYEDEFLEKKLILEVRETANLELLSSSYSGSVGDSGILTLRVKNSGNASVKDTSFSLNSKNPDLSFGRSATTEKYIGEWGEGEVKELDFKASVSGNALESEMTVQASSSFTNDGYPGQDSFTFGLQTSGENKFSLKDVEASLRKGSSNSMSGTVVNDADRKLKDVELIFRPQDPYLTVKQSSFAVGTLNAGESANFSFPVEVSSGAEPGPRLYSISGRYRNPDGDARSMTSVNFEADIEDSEGSFSVDVVNSSVKAGEGGSLTLKVKNPSNSVYENVDAKIFTSDPLSSSDDRAFVSELEPGTSERMKFKVSAGASALEKTYPVNMDFRYEVDGESKMSETYRAPVKVETVEQERFSAAPFVLVAALLVLGGSYYLGRPEKIWERISGE